ncbi:Protein N-terminal and lysine N-methyltransferase efm7 [Coemansia sp. RSA 989]|nr:Protein N-terminal and lysine N-methyltransferase efm7 [Coemansia sp. RSA 1086]KAJ1753386.1 Protein N-terminal and lysine N-methyltransferase efm7 [Coemansia sp. RSA 1821]KAJ1867752.1 Protein N-terminal and lysine N-methyltransferase efm7 [Coemansia sp. RSA 989]KAJ1875650.1 Protein N-terminal and lysine N-methyltransferase efm7 [Coemansia sp. RSA 990]KAJ2650740.1 Protein N-terminal and lysine N-methyltransferase efm7 [Coemansia sp. RSA 1250]KAJ2673909.1 Protein N-terminal and lysine N-methy
MSVESDTGDYGFESMFEEPADFRPPTPEAKLVQYERSSSITTGPETIQIRLLGSHPLWGHHLWNAAKVFAKHLDLHKEYVKNKTVLELGAAGALPSMIAAANQAERVVITDYPDNSLLDNIRKTTELNFPANAERPSIVVAGHKWGYDIDEIRELNKGERFDVLILCDLVFNHSEHSGLLESTKQLLRPSGKAFVVFTHHRPWLADKDMEFLEMAEQAGMHAEKIIEEYTGAMFDDDPGDEQVRGTVYGYCLSFA